MRRVLTAVLISVILVLAIAAVVVTLYYLPHPPRYAFVSRQQADQVTGELFNYSTFVEKEHQGTITSEELDYSVGPFESGPSLDMLIEMHNNSSQALHDYNQFVSYYKSYVNGTTGNTFYKSAINASFQGFTYSYFIPAKGYLASSFSFGLHENYLFIITVSLLAISNGNFTKLIQSQIQVMLS